MEINISDFRHTLDAHTVFGMSLRNFKYARTEMNELQKFAFQEKKLNVEIMFYGSSAHIAKQFVGDMIGLSCSLGSGGVKFCNNFALQTGDSCRCHFKWLICAWFIRFAWMRKLETCYVKGMIRVCSFEFLVQCWKLQASTPSNTWS